MDLSYAAEFGWNSSKTLLIYALTFLKAWCICYPLLHSCRIKVVSPVQENSKSHIQSTFLQGFRQDKFLFQHPAAAGGLSLEDSSNIYFVVHCQWRCMYLPAALIPDDPIQGSTIFGRPNWQCRLVDNDLSLHGLSAGLTAPMVEEVGPQKRF